MKHPLVSIIIVNYNHKYFPKLALEALENVNKYKNIEVIFIDNHSTDESIVFLQGAKKDRRIKLLELKKNIGFGCANNEGMKIAKGEYIYIHNPDVTVEADTISNLVHFLQTNENVGVIGPKLIYSSGEVQPSCRRDMGIFDLIVKRTFLSRFTVFKKRLEKYLMVDGQKDTPLEVDLLTGASLFGRRHILWERLKGFDPRYFLFMEDFDLCRKVRAEGMKVIYVPTATAMHYHKRLSGDGIFSVIFKSVFWLHIISAIKYFWKWK